MNYKKWIIFIITLLSICFSWIGLEYTLDGQVISQKSDSIFALLLSYLIADRIYYTYFYENKQFWCTIQSGGKVMEKRYVIYARNHEHDSNKVIDCADIDDMTDYANALLYGGYKDLTLSIEDMGDEE